MRDFISWHGWTSIPETGQPSSLPQTSLPPLSQPNTQGQPQVPSLTEFKKLMFRYLVKEGGPLGQGMTFEPPPPPSMAEQFLLHGPSQTQGPIYVTTLL